MKKLISSIFMLSVILLFTNCSKDSSVNLAKEHTIKLPLSSFQLDGENNSYWLNATSYLPIGERLEGAVLVFFVQGNLKYALPYNHYFNTGTAFNQHYYSVSTTGGLYGNSLIVEIRNSTGGQPYQTMSGTLTYKVITIPESVGVKSKGTGIDYSNYEEVKKFYGL